MQPAQSESNCPACAMAESNPLTGMYRACCSQCKARALASGPELHAAVQAGDMTPEYKQALQRLFGDDWEAAHLRVKAWKKRLKGASDELRKG